MRSDGRIGGNLGWECALAVSHLTTNSVPCIALKINVLQTPISCYHSVNIIEIAQNQQPAPCLFLPPDLCGGDDLRLPLSAHSRPCSRAYKCRQPSQISIPETTESKVIFKNSRLIFMVSCNTEEHYSNAQSFVNVRAK